MNGRFRLSAFNVSMEAVANALADYLRRPVLDETGLTGEYDFVLYWASGTADTLPFNPRPRPPRRLRLRSKPNLAFQTDCE
jgi:uncharacterized protein (TIGR03435 family)